MLLSFLKHLKLRLQFTGWLQYIPTAILTLAFYLVPMRWRGNALWLKHKAHQI